jgi:1-aminocyclopropane-1-carboxylate deaminase
LILKRDDLIHPSISGNKWRKMKYNLVEAQQQGAKQLITFGGAYSNHIYATASAGKVFGFDTLGIIRGDELNPQSSPTLQYAAENGMQFRFVSRTAYRDKEEILRQLKQEDIALEKAYYLPEGGSNHLALKGLAELVKRFTNKPNLTISFRQSVRAVPLQAYLLRAMPLRIS